MNRKGFQLVEVLLAVALAAGPLLVVFQLFGHNARAAHQGAERAAALLAMDEALQLLSGETSARLSELSGGDGSEARALLESRVAALPASIRDRYRDQLAPVMSTLRLEWKDLSDPATGLFCLELTARTSDGQRLVLRTALRASARP